MEKISRILPTSSRFRSPDPDFAQAARPGAPSMGLRSGLVSTRDRVSLSYPVTEVQRPFLVQHGLQAASFDESMRESKHLSARESHLVAPQSPVLDASSGDEGVSGTIHLIA